MTNHRDRTLLALASGALLALSFPRFGHPAAAWIALAPLLVAIVHAASSPSPLDAGRARHPRGGPGRLGFRLGLLAGLVYFAGTVYWIIDVVVTFGGLSRPIGAVVTALLVLYLSLFTGLFGGALAAIVAGAGPPAVLAAPAVWVASELLRRYLFGGFPWVLLGSSQVDVRPIAQAASVAGVYGVSALVVFVAAGLALAVTSRGRTRIAAVALPLAVVAGVAAWGAQRVDRGRLAPAGEPITVALVQGNIAQEDKWAPAEAGRILERYLRLSRGAAARGAELLIWPESSTPFFFGIDGAASERVRDLARETGTHLLFGSDEFEGGASPRYYNSAFLLGPDGRTLGVYRKMHLVPFGEYVPFKWALFFVSPLVESVSDFSPGRQPTVLAIGGRRLSTAICYEVVYPDLIGRFVAGGSELVTTITNDAWYGHSSAPHQHFQQAAMRAIEQGRYLVRAANTGISGIVDPYGRTLERSALFAETVIVREVRFLRADTIYARIGDTFAYASAVLTLAALVAVRRRRPRGADGRARASRRAHQGGVS